jgi:hypothetical protein
MTRFPKWSISCKLSNQIFICICLFLRAMCPAQKQQDWKWHTHKYIQVRYTISYPKFWKPKVFFMEVDSNLNTPVTMTTMTTLMYPLLQDPQARCNVPLLHVYVQVCSLVWAWLCLKFYLEIKSTLVILWSIFIPLKINSAMNNIYQLVPISCAKLSLSSWP